MLSPVERIHFWLCIMRDHTEFYLLSLSHRETESIRNVYCFQNTFIGLINEAETVATGYSADMVCNLVNKVTPVLINFINFKKQTLWKLLKCCIELNLPPTFVNHMINEAMEFYRELCSINSKPLSPTAENILFHKLWLPDAAGHAASIANFLDPVEFALIKEAEQFKMEFNNLFIKANELGIMLERTCLEDGSLYWFNKEVEKKIHEFICYLEKVKELRCKCRILGILKPLIPDHMIREEKYYLSNIMLSKCE